MSAFFHRNRVFLLHLSFWCVYLSFNLYQITVFQRARGIAWGRIVYVRYRAVDIYHADRLSELLLHMAAISKFKKHMEICC